MYTKEKNDKIESQDYIKFIQDNERKVNKQVSKIILYSFLVFPLQILLTVIGVFSFNYSQVIIPAIFGAILCTSAYIIGNSKISVNFSKHFNIMIASLLIMIMQASDWGVYITLCLTMLISCFYFDTKFTKFTAVIGIFSIIIGTYFRSLVTALPDIYETRSQWFMSYTLGYLFEFLAMYPIFIALTKKIRNVLIDLYNSQQTQQIIDNCNNASRDLISVLSELDQSIDTSNNNTLSITESTKSSLTACENNIVHIGTMSSRLNQMDSLLKTVTDQVYTVSQNTETIHNDTNAYFDLIYNASNNMDTIKEKTLATEEVMKSLEKHVMDISNFTQTITKIAAQTNILAINASIEAARAGKAGNGFVIVAQQVGKLASASKDAATQIGELIQKIEHDIIETKESLQTNAVSVEDGLESIKKASEESKRITNLQANMVEQSQNVENYCQQTKEHQKDILAMSDTMENLLKETREQIHAIVLSSENIIHINKTLDQSFKKVNNVAEDLLHTSEL